METMPSKSEKRRWYCILRTIFYANALPQRKLVNNVTTLTCEVFRENEPALDEFVHDPRSRGHFLLAARKVRRGDSLRYVHRSHTFCMTSHGQFGRLIGHYFLSSPEPLD